MSETKKGRGRPPASIKPNARRKEIKIRWSDAELKPVLHAMEITGYDFSKFVRIGAIIMARKVIRREKRKQRPFMPANI